VTDTLSAHELRTRLEQIQAVLISILKGNNQ
jgi:hypothetical protein